MGVPAQGRSGALFIGTCRNDPFVSAGNASTAWVRFAGGLTRERHYEH